MDDQQQEAGSTAEQLHLLTLAPNHEDGEEQTRFNGLDSGGDDDDDEDESESQVSDSPDPDESEDGDSDDNSDVDDDDEFPANSRRARRFVEQTILNPVSFKSDFVELPRVLAAGLVCIPPPFDTNTPSQWPASSLDGLH
jgi:hypothetical protein